ncbi:hypothetical protein D3C76_1668890 [compost metagenome]
MTLAARLRIGLEFDQRLGDELARPGRAQRQQIVMHHQRRVGRHQVDQMSTETFAQSRTGREHPGHVGFGNFIEQTHHQAIDRHHFNPWLHSVSC